MTVFGPGVFPGGRKRNIGTIRGINFLPRALAKPIAVEIEERTMRRRNALLDKDYLETLEPRN